MKKIHLLSGLLVIAAAVSCGDSADPADIPEKTYTVTGTIVGTDADRKANYWNPSNASALMTLEGEWYVARNIEFDYDYKFSDDASGGDYVEFKICVTGTEDAFGSEGDTVYEPNAEITVEQGGNAICLSESGVYDVYFNHQTRRVWAMESGYRPGESPAELDGHQWMAEVEGSQALFDFGVTEDEMLTIAVPSTDGSAFYLYMAGFYTVEASDKTSGTVLFTQYDWEFDEIIDGEYEFAYSNLTANSVDLVCEAVFGISDPVSLTLVEDFIGIEIEGMGGDGPEGVISDGSYWFTKDGKVMAPLAEDASSGLFPSEDFVDYASTGKNAFTFTYDSDYTEATGYLIQDSYGRYLGHIPDQENPEHVTLSAELPSGEDYGCFIWIVDNSYSDGTVDVYNSYTWCGIGYSADDNQWHLMSDTYVNASLRPNLVPAGL